MLRAILSFEWFLSVVQTSSPFALQWAGVLVWTILKILEWEIYHPFFVFRLVLVQILICYRKEFSFIFSSFYFIFCLIHFSNYCGFISLTSQIYRTKTRISKLLSHQSGLVRSIVDSKQMRSMHKKKNKSKAHQSFHAEARRQYSEQGK